MLRSRLALAAVVALSTAAVAGCAGSSADTGSGAGQPDAAFLAKVERVCVQGKAAFDANGAFPFANFDPLEPDPKMLPKVGRYFGRLLQTRRALPHQLDSLGSPATGRVAWASWKELALQDNAVAIKQARAARAGDAREFVATVKRLQALHARLQRAAADAGLPSSSTCSQIF